MRTPEEIQREADICLKNLNYLVKVNERWRAELPTIDKAVRPVGYANQIEGIRTQEVAAGTEADRYIELMAEKWTSQFRELSLEELSALSEMLKRASRVLAKEIKSREEKETSLF